MQNITIFLEQFALGNKDQITTASDCGRLSVLYLSESKYMCAKETAWPSTIQVQSEDDYQAAFAALDAGEVESLTMRKDLFQRLKADTDVITRVGQQVLSENDTPISIFNQVVG